MNVFDVCQRAGRADLLDYYLVEVLGGLKQGAPLCINR